MLVLVVLVVLVIMLLYSNHALNENERRKAMLEHD